MRSARPNPQESSSSPTPPRAWPEHAAPLSAFLVRSDPAADALMAKHTAQSRWATLAYLILHLLPGVLAYIGLFHAREPLMALTGWSNRYVQLAILGTMSIVWHIGLPFALLRWVDGLSLRESVRFLGLHAFDWRGLLTVLPVVTVIFTLLSIPYIHYVHTPLYAWLNTFPALAIQDWHILRIGYYDFPLPILAVVFIGNFFGEELYFRGYLLRKIGHLRGDWMINSFLFQLYHVWQAPLNWAYALAFAIIPYGLLVKWRRSLYGAIAFHLYINLAWGDVLAALAQLWS